MPTPPSPADSEHREIRQRGILELLRERAVASQGEVVALLEARGIQATQSSVSRDLKELGVARVGGRYVAPSSDEREPGLRDMARFLRSARPAGPHLTVVLTTAGTAQSVGIALDRAGWPEVVGTMAGDDTVFIATAGEADQRRLLDHLARFLEEER
jgi:transcriptional regulator of arginine metabolism